jgi:cytochrome P450 family 4
LLNAAADSPVPLTFHLPCVSGGYKIPAGVDIMIPILYVHRLAEHFPNPMNFDPDNFLAERVVKRHPCSFIPFSAGPRNCIGQKFGLLEVKTILSYILRHYKLQAIHKEITAIPAVVLEPENGVPVTVTARNMIPSA